MRQTFGQDKIMILDDFATIIWAVAKFRLSCSKQQQYKEVSPTVTRTKGIDLFSWA